MISKNLFFKLQIEDMKRRIWTIVLSMVAFFICQTVNCALRMEYFLNNNRKLSVGNTEYITRQIKELISAGSGLISFLTVVFAIVCGLSGFFYLHSRKKVDFYHSIPVRRETLFTFRYLNGILIYFVPYVINLALSLIILRVNNFLTMEIFTTAIIGMGINLLYYLLIYTVTIIAVMLTGNLVISFLGTAVFLSYGPILMSIKQMYFNVFFATYYSDSGIDRKILEFLSPIGLYISTFDKFLYYSREGMLLTSFIVLFVTAILLTFAVFLYKKRPSETAGNAMVYHYSKPIIKFLLVIPASLLGGIVFREFSGYNANGWLWFGLIFILTLSYALIEIIYNFDIKSAFRNKKHLLVCAAIVAVTACIFQFDLFQYDSYVPQKDQVKFMSVSIDRLDQQLRYIDDRENNPYNDTVTYKLNHMKLTDFNAAYDLAKLGAEKNILQPYINMDTFEFSVKYTLKSGREVYRTYHLTTDECYELVNDIYKNTEFKYIHYPIYQYSGEDIGGITVNNIKKSMEISLDNTEKQQLLDIYREELKALSLDDLIDQYPIAEISMDINGRYGGFYYVYPEFVRTKAFLEEHGFHTDEDMKMEDIKETSIINYSMKYVPSTMDREYITKEQVATVEPGTVTYSDTDKMKEIFPNIIRQDYYRNNGFVYQVEEGVEVHIVYKTDEFGNEDYEYYYFEKDKIPEFVKIDISYEEK